MKLRHVLNSDGSPFGYAVRCPGCGDKHIFIVGREIHPKWTFDGDMENPTFDPSLKREGYVDDKPFCCHFVLNGGIFDFQSDCTHEHANKKLAMVDWEE